jgi:ankyrin repeat protein
LLSIENERTEVVNLLLQRGADPNLQDSGRFTPLHLAAMMEDQAFVVALLEYGADPSIRDWEDRTPLHAAAIHDRWENCIEIMKYGGDPNANDKESLTPIDLARQFKSHRAYEVLSERAQGAK